MRSSRKGRYLRMNILEEAKEIFDNIYNLFNEFTELSDSKVFDFELDEEIGHIEIIGGIFILPIHIFVKDAGCICPGFLGVILIIF